MDYTILEYDLKTGKYTKIGDSCGDDSGEAKARFKEKTKWKPRDGIWLLAKGPVCR